MNIKYQRLTEKELDTFIEIRINQLREEGYKQREFEGIPLCLTAAPVHIQHITDGLEHIKRDSHGK